MNTKWNNVIFLAHASEDKAFVRRLYKRLIENGLSPWLDEENLEPGVRWEQKIKEAIKKSKIFLACISNNSVNKSGYIQKELRMALNELEQKPSEVIYFIPALIDNVELPDVSVGTINLRDFQYVKIYEEAGLKRLITYLKNNVGVIEDFKKEGLENFDEIENLIINNNLKKALEVFSEYLIQNNSDLINDAPLLLSRFNRNQKLYTKGLATEETYNRELIKITFLLLESMDLIKESNSAE